MKQEMLWQGDFGKNYTERSIFGNDQLDQEYVEEFGISKSDLNNKFLSNLEINNILEVGCNIGNQLTMLQSAGYQNLFGIELQPYAVERAKGLTKDINIIQGSALDLPFKDNYFNLVFTCGVLIHISPDNIKKVIREMYRVSNKYIWGFEYFSEEYLEIPYRRESNAMWKSDFAQIFMDEFPDLKLVQSIKLPRKISTSNYSKNEDMMYLLQKNAN